MDIKKEILKNKISIKSINMSGVYFLIKGNEIVYIGKTTKGYSRIYQHLYQKTKDFDYYFYASLPLDKIDEYENKYIIMFTPKYNNILPKGNTMDAIQKRIKEMKLKDYSYHYVYNIKKIINELKIKPITEINNKKYYSNEDVEKICTHIILNKG